MRLCARAVGSKIKARPPAVLSRGIVCQKTKGGQEKWNVRGTEKRRFCHYEAIGHN